MTRSNGALLPKPQCERGPIVRNAQDVESRLHPPRGRLLTRSDRRTALASGVTFITVIDRVLSANLSPLKVEDNIEPSLDWAESRLRVANVRDAHPAERTEGPNGVKFRGKIRHRRAPREAQWPGRSKLGTIPANLYPQVIEYWLEITAVNAEHRVAAKVGR